MTVTERSRSAWVLALAVAVVATPIVMLAQGSSDAGATAAPMPEVLSAQFVVSFFLVWLQQTMKNAKSIPVIQHGAKWANTILAWVFAIAQAVGIGWTFDTATGQLVITGLSLGAVFEVGRAYVSQKLIYKLVHGGAAS